MSSKLWIICIVLLTTLGCMTGQDVDDKRSCFHYSRCPNKCRYGYAHDQLGCTRCLCCRPLRCPNFCVAGYIVTKYRNVSCLRCSCKWFS